MKPVERTRVKICGITSPEDAELAIELGADYLGLNFYDQSPRFVEVDRAREVMAAVSGRADVVGVFVNALAPTVERIDDELGLDLLQFHGDEGLDDLAPFADRAIKVLRLDAPPAPGVFELWADVWGFLVEGRQPRLYGGSGQSWAYEMIGSLPRHKPVIVAGGLGPDNVAEAIRQSRAWGVDVCSGVESSPGVKSPGLMRSFLREVRQSDG